MKHLSILAILIGAALGFLTGCASDPYSACEREARVRNAHPALGLGTIIADALDPPPPHPPLEEMLAACARLRP